MHTINKLAAVLAAVSTLAFATPAQAGAPASDAAKLRRLDIMLMVSSLRCRFGADNFQADYARFSDTQSANMADAFRTLQADYTARMGVVGARKALDSISVGMANEYGQGHPWLGCGELKTMTRSLADTTDRSELLAAADDVLGDAPHGTLLATRR